MNAPFRFSPLSYADLVVASNAGALGRLKLRHACLQLSIVRRSIDAEVHAPMAVGTQRYYVGRMIRTTIAHAAKVMRLEVSRAVRPPKWRILYTALAGTLCTREHVGANVPASAEYIAHGLRGREHRLRSLESPCPQRGEIASDFLFFIVDDCRNAIERTKLKDKCVASLPIAIGFFLDAVACADVLAFVAQHTVIGLLEEQQALASGRMFGDGAVALVHHHWPHLAFADVLEDAVVSLEIDIPVIEALLPCNQDDERVVGRCDDAALLLATKGRVDITPAIVGSASLKRPRHHRQRSPRSIRLNNQRLRINRGTRNQRRRSATALARSQAPASNSSSSVEKDLGAKPERAFSLLQAAE